jgi:hypothetical protein
LTCNGVRDGSPALHTLEIRKDGAETKGQQPIPFRLTDDFQWMVDWKTKGLKAGVYQLVARLADGRVHTIWVKLQ